MKIPNGYQMIGSLFKLISQDPKEAKAFEQEKMIK